MNSTVHSAGSQFSPMRSTTARTGRRHRRWLRLQLLVEHEADGILAGGRDHQQAQAGPGRLRVDLLDDRQRIGDVGAAPAEARARRPGSSGPASTCGRARGCRPGCMSRKRPAWCSVSTPVMWSSTTITSSTWPSHCCAKMPMVAEPQPTRMRSSRVAVDDRRPRRPAPRTVAPPSIASSTASPLHSASSASQVTCPPSCCRRSGGARRRATASASRTRRW